MVMAQVTTTHRLLGTQTFSILRLTDYEAPHRRGIVFQQPHWNDGAERDGQPIPLSKPLLLVMIGENNTSPKLPSITTPGKGSLYQPEAAVWVFGGFSMTCSS